MNQTNKTAIILGATSGIGKEIALILLDEGWKVGIAGRRKERLEEIQKQYGKGLVEYEVIDITSPDATEKADSLLSRLGRMDLYLHVSGIGFQNSELEPSVELSTCETNSTGFMRMAVWAFRYFSSQAGEGMFDKSRPAHMAVISSVAGTRGMGAAPAYSATKKMQSTYIDALAQLARMRKLPIRFSDIRPGFVETDILNKEKHYPLMIKAPKAAGLIVKRLEKRQRTIIIDWKFRIIVMLWKLIPQPIWERLSVKN